MWIMDRCVGGYGITGYGAKNESKFPPIFDGNNGTRMKHRRKPTGKWLDDVVHMVDRSAVFPGKLLTK